MRTMKAPFTLASVFLVLTATPLPAQQPAPSGHRPMRPMAGMPMMGCAMMSAMMPGPAAALQSASALKLTQDQRTRLDAAKGRLDAQCAPSMDSMRAIHTELMALAQRPTLDEQAARAVSARMGRIHADMALAMLRASHDANAILTPVQRDSLAAMVKRQMPMSGSMPMSGMPMHPMPGAGAVPKH
jgi:Spy/CpxP family protein refolding chaperone